MVASLLFPGLGHRRVGRGLDGLARAVLFTLLAAMAATMLLSGVSSPVMFGVAALFVVGAVLVYAGSAWEASHIAEGGQPVVSSRTLLWTGDIWYSECRKSGPAKNVPGCMIPPPRRKSSRGPQELTISAA